MFSSRKFKDFFGGFVSLCSLLTLLIVILDYFGFGKQFWKENDPAKMYSLSEESKEEVYKVIGRVVSDMNLSESKEKIFIDGERALTYISFHIQENTRYALNVLKPEERYYSKKLKILFYTSHDFSYNGHESCKRLTVEWPKSLNHLKNEGTKMFCMIDGAWKQI